MQRFVIPCNNLIASKKFIFFYTCFILLQFSSFAQSPGGVSANLQLWLKAGAGTGTSVNSDPVLTWADLSPSAFSFTADHSNGPDNPTFISNSINFNPAVSYGTSAMHSIPWATGPSLLNSTVFVAGKAGVAAYDTYNAAWTSFSSSSYKILCPYLNGNQMGVYDSIAFAEDYTPLTWNAGEISFIRNRISSSSDVIYAKQGTAEHTITGLLTPAAATNKFATLGNNLRDGFSEPFGMIAETLIYNTASLSTTDIQKIESYLGLKYGVTLDQSSPQDYIASDGSAVWSASAASAGFNLDIFGIGKDAASGLDQRVSQSANAGILTIATTNDFVSANLDVSRVSLSDLNFITIAGSTGQVAWTNTGTLPGYSFLRKQWQVQQTGSVGTVYLQFDADNPNFDIPPAFGGVYYIVTDPNGDGDYTDGTATALTHTSGSLWTVALTLANGSKFTLATQGSPAPGGVLSHLELWLRTDAGTSTTTNNATIASWTDNNGWVSNATGNPAYADSSINYNPSVLFGVADYDTIPPFMPVSNSTVFLAGIPQAASSIDGYRNAWTSYDQTDFPMRINTGSLGHSGNGGFNDPSITWNDNEVSFSRQHILSNNDVIISKQGAAEATLPAAAFGTSTYYNVGNDLNDFEGFGNIAETFIYNTSTLTTTDIQKIETYLALKYGVTLKNTGAGGGDYRLSNSAIAWTASDNAAYHNQVIGIVRDDASALLQKQSHTQDDSLRVFVGNLAAGNASNSGAISNNFSSIVIGNNGGRQQADIGTKPAGIVSMFGRSWKITNTNFGDPFSIEIKWDSVGTFNIDDIRLLVSVSPDMSVATVVNKPEVNFSLGSIIISGITTGTIPMNATSYISIGSASASTTLPVGITAFTAAVVNNGSVALAWQTSTEKSNNYFTVQKSTDGNTWKDLTQVKGAGNSTVIHNYTASDNNPYTGVSFYRLKQTDFDGKAAFSATRTVHLKAAALVSIYPNPASTFVTITGQAAELRNVKLYNISGQDVTAAARLVEINSSRMVIDVSRLKKGVYTIKTSTVVSKIVKQ